MTGFTPGIVPLRAEIEDHYGGDDDDHSTLSFFLDPAVGLVDPVTIVYALGLVSRVTVEVLHHLDSERAIHGCLEKYGPLYRRAVSREVVRVDASPWSARSWSAPGVHPREIVPSGWELDQTTCGVYSLPQDAVDYAELAGDEYQAETCLLAIVFPTERTAVWQPMVEGWVRRISRLDVQLLRGRSGPP